MLRQEGPCIIYRERALPLGLRAAIGVIGLGVGLGIPFAWLANVGAGTPPWVWALVGGVVLVSAALGGFFVMLAFAGTTELRIDPARDAVTRHLRGPLRSRSDAFARRQVGPPEILMRASEDGPFPILRLPLPRGRPVEMACFDSRAEAERWCAAIAAALRA